jgi:hypothetical protein
MSTVTMSAANEMWRKYMVGAVRLRGPRAIAAPRLPAAPPERDRGLSALLRSRSDYGPSRGPNSRARSPAADRAETLTSIRSA